MPCARERADIGRLDRHPAATDEHNLIELLELQRLTRELLEHLTAMFSVEEAADLLRTLADALYRQCTITEFRPAQIISSINRALAC